MDGHGAAASLRRSKQARAGQKFLMMKNNFGIADVRYLVKTFKFLTSIMLLILWSLDHHPEWRNVFNHVTVSLTTWDARRKVTIYDLSLALYMNMAAKAVLKYK